VSANLITLVAALVLVWLLSGHHLQLLQPQPGDIVTIQGPAGPVKVFVLGERKDQKKEQKK